MRKAALLAALFASALFLAMQHSPQVHAAAPASAHVTVQTTQSNHDKIIMVQAGDYLAKIAEANNTTVQRLYDANVQVKNPDLIYPGEKLRIPNASETLTPRVLSGQTSAVTAPATITQVAPIQPPSQPTAAATSAPSGSVWDELAQCESSGNWAINTGNGFYGGLQFTLSSWQAVGGIGYPNQASRDTQITLAKKLQAIQGWNAWPACSTQLDL